MFFFDNFEVNVCKVIPSIKSLGRAKVFFISVASPVFSENPPKFHQKSQIYRTPLTGRLAKRSAKIKITPIPNSSLIPCFDMLLNISRGGKGIFSVLRSRAFLAQVGRPLLLLLSVCLAVESSGKILLRCLGACRQADYRLNAKISFSARLFSAYCK